MTNLNALALYTGITTESSISHVVSSSIKNLASLSFAANTEVKELDTLISFLKDPSKLLSMAQTTTVKTEEKQEEKKPVVEEEEVQEDIQLGGGLFDDDDDW